MQAIAEIGQKLFEENIRLTGISDYGLSWEALTKDGAAVPPQGARFELTFEGTLKGDKLSGTIKGVDYLNVRTDGRFELNIFATITTHDGARIAFDETGILTPRADGISDLHLNMKFTTGHERYLWLNKVQAWGRGSVESATGQAQVTAFIV